MNKLTTITQSQTMNEKIALRLKSARLYLDLLKQGCDPKQLPLIINVGVALTQIETTLSEIGSKK